MGPTVNAHTRAHCGQSGWLTRRVGSCVIYLVCLCFSEKAEPVASLNANPPSSDLVALAPTPSAPPPTLALVSRQMGDSKPPQAIVKPQILTHIIEGFVIQEGAEPFPVRAATWKGDWDVRAQNCLIIRGVIHYAAY